MYLQTVKHDKIIKPDTNQPSCRRGTWSCFVVVRRSSSFVVRRSFVVRSSSVVVVVLCCVVVLALAIAIDVSVGAGIRELATSASSAATGIIAVRCCVFLLASVRFKPECSAAQCAAQCSV